MNAFLTIIIPIYNIKEVYLKFCFESLLRQTNDKFVVYAIDDGSPDNSGKICDYYASLDSRIKVIHQVNQGVSVARNVGIDATQTEWLTFIDPDDWIEPNLVESIYNIIKKEENVNIIFYDYYQEFSNKQKKKHLYDETGFISQELTDNIKLAPFNQLIVEGKHIVYETNVIWNKTYRTSLIKSNKIYFDPKALKGQDVIFIAELLQHINKIFYLKKALYHYRYLENSITNRFNPNVKLYNEIAYSHYERIINKFNLPDIYKKYYYIRIITRLYSCMRLYYFHTDNKKTKKQINHELNEILNTYPYNIALKNIDFRLLTTSQKIFLFFIKRKYFNIMRLLVYFKQKISYLIGNQLKKQ